MKSLGFLAQTSTDNSFLFSMNALFRVFIKAFYPSVTDIKPTFFIFSPSKQLIALINGFLF